MKRDPSWGEIFIAFVLVVMSFLGIVIFLVVPYAKGMLGKTNDNTASVSVQTQVGNELPSVTTSEENNPSGEPPVESEPVKPPVIEIPEGVTRIEWEKIEHPSMSDCDIVLIGDSIFVTGSDEEPSTTVGEIMKEFTGTRVYTLAIPGMCAAEGEVSYVISQQEAVKHFLNLTQVDSEDAELFNSELGRFANDDHTGRQLIVIMDCTINDYFMSRPLTGVAYDENTYFGAITNCINMIKSDNPYAIVCYVKTHCLINGKYGYDFNKADVTYNMYKEQMMEACKYEQSDWIICDGDRGINYDNVAEFLTDGTHLNYEGRRREAGLISEYLFAYLQSY